MLKFSKWFKGKKQDSQIPKMQEIDEVDLLEQEERNSTKLLYGLPPVQEGQVTINNTGVSPSDGALLVSFFISNGLNQKVKFESVPLVLIDSEKQVLARQLFDGDTIGEIAGGTAKACVVRFDESNVYDQDIPEECQVCFDVPSEHSENTRIRYQAMPDNLTESQEQELERVLAELSPMEPGEVNISPLQAQITSENDLMTTVIIRNATDKALNLEQISLAAFDAHRNEIARGQFDITELTIEPYKAILWTFDFGFVGQDKDFDLSSWSINIANDVEPLQA